MRLTKEIIEDYMPAEGDNLIFCEDDAKIYAVKKALASLPETHKRVVILYAECGSMRKVAKILGVSAGTICQLLKTIRKDIYEYINNIGADTTKRGNNN